MADQPIALLAARVLSNLFIFLILSQIAVACEDVTPNTFGKLVVEINEPLTRTFSDCDLISAVHVVNRAKSFAFLAKKNPLKVTNRRCHHL